MKLAEFLVTGDELEIEEKGVDELDLDTSFSEKDEAYFGNYDKSYDIDLPDEGINDMTEDDSLSKFLSSPLVELQLAILVLLSSFLVGLGTLRFIPPFVSTATTYGELVISAIFTLEYVCRWKVNNFSLKYLVTPLALIDLLAILPAFIKEFSMLGVIFVPASLTGSALINLRLLRILRLQRVLVDDETFQKFEVALGLNPSDIRPYQLQLARVVISIFTLLSVTAGLVYSAEHNVNPDISDYFTSFYFTLTTLTTVGFGDIHPITNAGRWFVGSSILISSVVLPAQGAALVEALLQYEEYTKAEKEPKANRYDGSRESKFEKAQIKIRDEDMIGVVSRIKRLENKLDETNRRIERVLELLERKEE